MAARVSGLVVLVVVLASCGPGGGGGDDGGGMRVRSRSRAPTGARCTDGSTLTYETFAQSFFGMHCVRCHDAARTTVSERGGAPLGTDLDTLEGIRMHLDAIDAAAAAGPTRVNLYMPPPTHDPTPSDEERDLLGEWIACGAP